MTWPEDGVALTCGVPALRLRSAVRDDAASVNLLPEDAIWLLHMDSIAGTVDLGVTSFRWVAGEDRLSFRGSAARRLEALGVGSIEDLLRLVAEDERQDARLAWRTHAELEGPLRLNLSIDVGRKQLRRVSLHACMEDGISRGTLADVTGEHAAGGTGGTGPDADGEGPDLDGIGPYTYDAEAGLHRWSTQLCRLIGLSPDRDQRLSTDAILARIHPGDLDRFERAAATAMQRPEPYRLQYRMQAEDGRVVHVEDRGIPFGPRDPETGRFRCARGVLIDVTDRATTETRLSEASAMLAALFENAPLGLAIWDTDLRYVRVNERLAEMNGFPVERHLGKRPDELLPGIDGLEGLLGRWREVARSGEPWLDVEIEGETAAAPGRRRSWLEHFYPISVDGRTIGLAGIVEETTERKAAEVALRQSEMRLKEVLDGTLAFIGIVDDEGRLTEINAAALELGGHRREDVIGKRVWESAFWSDDPMTAQAIEEAVALAREGGVSHFDVTTRAADGSDVNLDWMLSPTLDDMGQVRYMTISAVDITERVRAAEQVETLLREVNHRSKNMLALVQAIARQTARSGATDFIERFSQRIASLSRSQDLLVSSDWKPVDLRALVLGQLDHLRDLVDRQVTLAGPPFELPPEQAHILGMAIHELATNATKYGALSTPEGTVSIAWSVEGPHSSRRLTLGWTERSGPPVALPDRRGFGTTVLKDLVESSLGAEVDLDYAPAGLSWAIRTGGVAPVAATGTDAARAARVLVVEDEALLAYEFADVLRDAGFEVVGPAGSVAMARRLLEHEPCDIAVLDINLGRETSEPLAEQLLGRKIPVIAISGYSKEQHPTVFRDAHFMPKPFDARRLVPKIRALIS